MWGTVGMLHYLVLEKVRGEGGGIKLLLFSQQPHYLRCCGPGNGWRWRPLGGWWARWCPTQRGEPADGRRWPCALCQVVLTCDNAPGWPALLPLDRAGCMVRGGGGRMLEQVAAHLSEAAVPVVGTGDTRSGLLHRELASPDANCPGSRSSWGQVALSCL